jgi:hypothetical protein
MRKVLLAMVILSALAFTGCSYSTDFVVVNISAEPVVVQYKLKAPAGPLIISEMPAKAAASQLPVHRDGWQKLRLYQFQFDQETRVVTVSLMPGEALKVTSMFHYIGDSDPNDVAAWPIEELVFKGANSDVTFTGGESRKSFSRASMALYMSVYWGNSGRHLTTHSTGLAISLHVLK